MTHHITDEQIESVISLAHKYADAKLMRYGMLGIKEPPDPQAAFEDLQRAVIALAAPAPAVPSGWKLVPVEPTREMNRAGFDAHRATGLTGEIWRAMLTAAPTPPVQPAAPSLQPACRYISDVLAGDASSGEKHIARTIMHLLPLEQAMQAAPAVPESAEGAQGEQE